MLQATIQRDVCHTYEMCATVVVRVWMWTRNVNSSLVARSFEISYKNAKLVARSFEIDLQGRPL